MPKEVFVKIHLSEENNRLNKAALEIAKNDRALRVVKPTSRLPPEPEDYDDPKQMKRYLAKLRKFFHLG